MLPFFVPAFAPGSLTLPKDFATKVDRYLSYRASRQRFSGVVAFQKEGKTVFRKAYGYADSRTHRPMTLDTPLVLFSVSKMFTAAAILLLQERGKLKVEDPVAKYLPDFPPVWREITIHQLLTHTSGLDKTAAAAWFDSGGKAPAVAPAHKAGTQWEYSNLGYLLLSRVVAKVADEPYNRFVRREIFDRIGMKGAGTGGYWEGARKLARGHYAVGGKLLPFDQRLSVIEGAGNITATVDDMLKWLRALDGPGFLSEASRKAMFTPWFTLEPSTMYAYGWFYHDDARMWEHSGGGAGNSCELVRLPEQGLDLVVMGNLASDLDRTNYFELLGFAYGMADPVGQFPRLADLDAYQGIYRLPDGKTVRVSAEQGELKCVLPGGRVDPVRYVQDRLFKSETTRLEFLPRKGGGYDLRFGPLARARTAVRQTSDPVGLPDLAGDYVDPESGKDATVVFRDGRLYVRSDDAHVMPEGPPFALIPEAKDRFWLMSLPVRIRFVRDKAGRAAGMVLGANGAPPHYLPRHDRPALRLPLGG